MTLAEPTRSRTRQTRSVAEIVASLDWWKVARMSVWVAFCVLLIVLR